MREMPIDATVQRLVDAQILGREVPIGMIFVPSIGGVSHAPAERTAPEHLVAGAQVLLGTLLALDDRLA